ncbi:hypothetical protein CERSUDRAFT_125315 [Gelatoporia subvermispora B]|uniref:NAD(P)-binding domain-containing protein n=1 Tax=Ceriporiopsis subvermispora (strain B) TaxID=914234 RepID=M2QCL5_CERS8|nr:hypothetical protein CERSUDRAFT_125315 [Gelatoporia subvermispora B]
MRLLLTGATGVAGLAIYRAALNDPIVTSVTILSRRAIPSWAELPANASSKTEVILHEDFTSYPPELAQKLATHDACIWALGKASAGMNEQDYTKLTYDYPMAAARALKHAGVGTGRAENPFRFVYISGEAADPTEKSFMMWARVKGRAEKDLTEFCNGSEGMLAHILRPAYFFPSKNYPEDRKNQRSSSAAYADCIMTPLISTLLPGQYTPVEDLGRFAVEAAKGRWSDETLFRNARMRELLKQAE